MWPSSAGHKDHNKGVVSLAPSKPKSKSKSKSKSKPSSHRYTSACSSPSSHIPPTTPTTNKSMDEIWKDIHLISSLHRPSSAFHLQDFLPPPPPPTPHHHLQSHPPSAGRSGGPHSSRPHPPPPPPPPPVTTLNLGSGPDSRNIVNLNKSKSKQQSRRYTFVEKVPSTVSPLSPPPCGTWHSIKSKRPAAETEDDQSADGRFKRMIKNRESAARSRDRKHAYTSELELEVARLKKENAKMRRQQEMFCLPAMPAQLPKKPTLSRTLTAPF